MRSAEGSRDAGNLTTLVPSGPLDTAIPRFERFKWPKAVPPLSGGQEAIADDFVKRWHDILAKRYSSIERFNHTYPLRRIPEEHTGGHWNSVLALAVTSNLNRSTVKSTTVSSCVK